VAAPVLVRPAIATFSARVMGIDLLAARDLQQLALAPIAGSAIAARGSITLPTTIRVNLANADVPPGLTQGAIIHLGARLMPPPDPDVPGAYDFASVAWFSGLGATGRTYAPVTLLTPAGSGDGIRTALSRHIQHSLPGSAGGIAAARRAMKARSRKTMRMRCADRDWRICCR
jgi:competence protein ComEC